MERSSANCDCDGFLVRDVTAPHWQSRVEWIQLPSLLSVSPLESTSRFTSERTICSQREASVVREQNHGQLGGISTAPNSVPRLPEFLSRVTVWRSAWSGVETSSETHHSPWVWSVELIAMAVAYFRPAG